MDVNDNFTQSVHQKQMDRISELEAELASVTAERDAARRVIEAAIVQMKVETERAEEGA
jgi:predicted transcriptional regulator